MTDLKHVVEIKPACNQMRILKIKNELVLLSPRELNLIFGNVTPSKEGVS